MEGAKNKIWIGTANGITILNTETNTFTQIDIPNPDNLQFGTSTAFVTEDVVDNEEIIWTNSYAGLIRYNLSKNIFNYNVVHVVSMEQTLCLNGPRLIGGDWSQFYKF